MNRKDLIRITDINKKENTLKYKKHLATTNSRNPIIYLLLISSQNQFYLVVVVTVLITVDLLVAPVTVAVDTVMVAVLATLVTKAEQALDRMLAGYLVKAAGVEAAEDEATTARFDNDEEDFDDEVEVAEEEALVFKVVVEVTVDTGILVDVAVT